MITVAVSSQAMWVLGLGRHCSPVLIMSPVVTICMRDEGASMLKKINCLTSISNNQLIFDSIQINLRRILWSRNVILEVIRI